MNVKKTIETIILSSEIDQFVIGVTKDSIAKRKAYESEGFDHYVVVEFDLTADSALDHEEILFKYFTENKAKTSYKKYHHEKRDKPYVRSAGGAKSDYSYDLYIAWKNKKGSDKNKESF